MRNYLKLLHRIMSNGELRSDRTGVGTRALFCERLDFDLRNGFPAVTTKKLFFKSVAAELLGFLKGYESAADFRVAGTSIWDANANASYWQETELCKGTDDMGRVYGVQWRKWRKTNTGETTHIDQLGDVLERIKVNPTDRRLCVTAWNPGELDEMCLPPCHLYFQFFASNDGHLDVVALMRSVDSFLGMPFDIASYALLLELAARHTGRKARKLSMVFADTHIYNNHYDAVQEQLSRIPRELPTLRINQEVTGINDFDGVDQVQLIGYDPYPAIKAEMAL